MKILLIDDSTLSRNILKRSLGDHKFVEAENGLRGIELFFLEKPDLVILDLTMPGLNGFEILEKIRQIDPSARIIIGSADIQEFSRKKAEELGAIAFLTKPFMPEQIHDVLAKVSQMPR